MVVADTSVWIPYFNQPDSQEKAILDALIQHDNLALVGIVVAELLQGCRSAKEAAALVETLSALPFIGMTFPAWKRAGEISASLRRRGITLPLSDLIIAGLALDQDCAVFTLDPHFRKIPGLRLYRPSKVLRG
jgi:predicted nucleic acid-binding protein